MTPASIPPPLDAWRAVLKQDPFDAAALHGLGHALLLDGRPAQAVALLSAAAAQRDDAAILTDLGAALNETGAQDEALAALRQAVTLAPDLFAARYNLGRLLLSAGQPEDALPALRQAHQTAPDATIIAPALAACLVGCGNAALARHAPQAAEALYREALAINPRESAALGNLGNALTAQLRLTEALAAYRQALDIDPDNAGLGFGYSLCLLLAGDFDTGWRWYEKRRCWIGLRANYVRRPEMPSWQPGQSLVGRHVLLTAEQGSGDTIQYARFAPVLARIAASVVLEVPWPLAALFADQPVITLDDPAPPECDITCPLLSLPLVLGPEAGAAPPYLQASDSRIGSWAAWLDRASPDRRVGLVCRGDPGHPRDQERSIPLARFAGLLETPGISFVLVQTEIAADDRAAFDAAPSVRCPGAALTDYADTAALLCGLDLLISVDTSVAHLAGALGRPVWTLLPFCPDYRWLTGRDDTPWYPSMRLYRQTRAGDWDDVIRRVLNDL